MLTETQKNIIKEVCSIQYESLINILTNTDLGTDSNGQKWSEILKDFEIDRKHLDEELIKVITLFKGLKENPEQLKKMGDYTLSVFLKILVNFKHKWERSCPNAYINLLNKVTLWLDTAAFKIKN